MASLGNNEFKIFKIIHPSIYKYHGMLRDAHKKSQIAKIMGPTWGPPGPWFNIKMTSYQYKKSHYGDKTVVRSSYLHNGISYTGKMTSLYWFGPPGSYRPHPAGPHVGPMNLAIRGHTPIQIGWKQDTPDRKDLGELTSNWHRSDAFTRLNPLRSEGLLTSFLLTTACWQCKLLLRWRDTGVMTSQITDNSTVYATVVG